ncbi:hypothetical protein L7F22_062821 [Adiantum nelumboides]|nr:hypothetical protein [Adiantum nelumboides]
MRIQTPGNHQDIFAFTDPGNRPIDSDKGKKDAERKAILGSARSTFGNVKLACYLGISLKTFHRKLKTIHVPGANTCEKVTAFDKQETIHTHQRASSRREKRGQRLDRKDNSVEDKKGKDHDLEELNSLQEAKRPIWRNWGMIAAIAVYCLWGLHDMAYSEIFSLWAVSPETYGGLGFTTSNVGNVLAVSGAALLMFQLFVFAPLANRFGAIQMIRWPTVVTFPLVAVFPLIANLRGVSLWTSLISAAVIKNVLSDSPSNDSDMRLLKITLIKLLMIKAWITSCQFCGTKVQATKHAVGLLVARDKIAHLPVGLHHSENKVDKVKNSLETDCTLHTGRRY